MGGVDMRILVAVPLVAAALGFWFLVLAPKQQEASELGAQIESLNTTIAEAEAELATAEQARADFDRNYADLVSLGAAAPEDNDQSTLINELASLSNRNNLRFGAFEVGEVADAAPVPATPAPATTPPDDSTTTTSAAPATEAAAAVLPIGAAVGSAGLPVTPYDFSFTGNFFDTADFLADLDSAVEVTTSRRRPSVDGRLVTINGFALVGDVQKFPKIQANFDVTTYLVPGEQGLDAGASSTAPPPVAASAPPTAPAPQATPPTATVSP